MAARAKAGREPAAKPAARPELPLVTLYLFSTLLFVYYVSVGFLPFVSPSTALLENLGLHYYAPWSVFTYMFIHLWPSHLLVDCLLLLIFGTIVERKVGGWRTFLIFVSSGLVGGLMNLLFYPGSTLIGSSGAVFGLIGAAIALHPFLSFTLFVLSLNIFSPLLVRAVESAEYAYVERIAAEKIALSAVDASLREKMGALAEQRAAVNGSLAAAQQQEEGLESSLVALEADKAAGRIGEQEYQERSQRLLSDLAQIKDNLSESSIRLTLVSRDIVEASEERREIISAKAAVEQTTGQLEATKRTKEATPQANWPHAAGILLGGILVFLLRRETFPEWERKYEVIEAFLARRR